MATNRATSANITRVLRNRGYDVIPARDTSRRLDDGLQVSSVAGAVAVRVKNFRKTLNMGDTVVNVKRDLVFEGYDVRIGYGDAGEDQTVLYVRNEEKGA